MPETVLKPHGSYLTQSLEHASVADAMHPGILSCGAATPLTEVARMMSSHHVHCVVVRADTSALDDDASVLGIVSDFDVLRAGIRSDGPDTAAELARQPILKLETTARLRDAAELMLAESASHVVAVSPETKRPVGILSTLDIAGILGWGEM